MSPKRTRRYIKRKSADYKRNQSGKLCTSTTPVTAPTLIADLALKSGSKSTSTNGYQLFVSSDHPSWPQTAGTRDGRGDLGAYATTCSHAYKSLPDREAFELEA